MNIDLKLDPDDISAIADQVVFRLKKKMTSTPDPDEWFDIDELCAYLKVGKDWVYKNQRSLPHHRVTGRLIRYKKSEIERWMKKKSVPGA